MALTSEIPSILLELSGTVSGSQRSWDIQTEKQFLDIKLTYEINVGLPVCL